MSESESCISRLLGEDKDDVDIIALAETLQALLVGIDRNLCLKVYDRIE